MPSRTHEASLDNVAFSSDIHHPTSKCPLFSNRRLLCTGYWESHLSPCLTSRVEEMGNPFKMLVLKPSDSAAPPARVSSREGRPFLSSSPRSL